jgi:hypothetical protein
MVVFVAIVLVVMVVFVAIALVAMVAFIALMAIVAMIALIALIAIVAMVALIALIAIVAVVALIALIAIVAMVAFIARVAVARHARSDPLFQFLYGQVHWLCHMYLFVCCCYVSPAFWIQTNEPASAVRSIIWRPPWHPCPQVTFVTWGSGCSQAEIPSPARD